MNVPLTSTTVTLVEEWCQRRGRPVPRLTPVDGHWVGQVSDEVAEQIRHLQFTGKRLRTPDEAIRFVVQECLRRKP